MKKAELAGLGLCVIAPAATMLAWYGTLSPCGALKMEMRQKMLSEFSGANPFAALGLALADKVVDQTVNSLGPLQCTRALWRIKFSNDAPFPRLGSGTSAEPREAGPSPSDFKIVSYRGEWDDDRLRVVGELKNIGSVPAGAEIEVIARDSKGVLVDSQSFWPNSTNNIPVRGSCGIGYTITRNRRASKIEAKVISARVW
jgi:hypothetical protein